MKDPIARVPISYKQMYVFWAKGRTKILKSNLCKLETNKQAKFWSDPCRVILQHHQCQVVWQIFDCLEIFLKNFFFIRRKKIVAVVTCIKRNVTRILSLALNREKYLAIAFPFDETFVWRQTMVTKHRHGSHIACDKFQILVVQWEFDLRAS